MTAEQIVRETIEYYAADPSRRASYIDEKKLYRCKYKAPNGNMCAVGRCMMDPKENWDGIAEDISGPDYEDIDDILKEEYRGHDTEMWIDIQNWHDTPENWSEDAITKIGQERADKLLERYKGK